MLTKAVSMDVKVGTANRANKQDGVDNGFSDVLGNVKKDGGSSRSLNGQKSGVSKGREFGKEFGFTRQADNRPAGRISDDMRGQPGTSGSSFKDSVSPADAEKIEDLLNKAAELVTEAVRETGETPDKAEAAEMLAEAVEELTDGKLADSAEIPDDAMINAIMQVLAAISGGTAEDGSVVVEQPADDVIEVADVTNGEAAAMLADMQETGLTASDGGQTAAESGGEEFAALMTDSNEVMSEPGYEADLKAFVGDSVQKLADGRLSVEAAAAEFGELEVSESSGQAPELSDLTVSETVKMLADLIEEVKDELGITEIGVRQVYGGEGEESALPDGGQAELSNRMFRTDRTGELDHILNGTRFDVSAEDDDKPETETYDAVHMAAELMSDRTDTDIPVDDGPMFPTGDVRPPEVQTAEQILDRIQSMQDDHTEFTMVLNPESLGRITVKIAAAGERISVEITADDPRTGAMLAARSDGLQNMLRDNGVQLEKCQIVSEHEDTQFNEQSYDGSSKNPYGRSDDDEKKQDGDDSEGGSFYDLLQSI